MNGLDLLTNQKFVSVAELQAGSARLLSLAEKSRSFYKVMKNNKPVGTLVPENVWNALILQLRLLSSKEMIAEFKMLAKEKEFEFLDKIIAENGKTKDNDK
jgi:PHD/YefM family antitoxin component YafN of YafNO toxin-antitoxin module